MNSEDRRYYFGFGWLRGWLYRSVSRVAHRFHWHHMPLSHLEDGATLEWCHWCGIRNRITPLISPLASGSNGG